ncbi:unnamed protein product [Rhizoctonia solani]|uniref:Transmembrane protein n=1 Tax=Rhizoctonia solani TaxID=456999 RepID=A0A8H3HBT2_9AGAM|nr:unnamed protein product [Rhizoctonia solani]
MAFGLSTSLLGQPPHTTATHSPHPLSRAQGMPESSSRPLETPGAGPSKPRPPPLPISHREHLDPQSPGLRTRTPTRSSSFYQEVELGVYLNSERPEATPRSLQFSSSSSRLRFSTKISPSTTPIVGEILSGPKSVFLANSEWCTDIVTFCSHARLDSGLGQARITHVQARKSHRPPFLHEYLLVFFTAANNQRFVARIDRLGKVKLTSVGGIWTWFSREHRNDSTAIQQVEMYHIQDEQCGVDSSDGPWFKRDGRWGSEPIATLVSSTNEKMPAPENTNLSVPAGPTPRLKDVSQLLEAILLEMPTYHLVTTNCYFMTRSSLLLLQRCFPTSFACHMGSTSDELIHASQLAEPIWAGLIKWYLPFAIAIFLLYFPLLVLGHVFLSSIVDCGSSWTCAGKLSADQPRMFVFRALRLALHGMDIPLPLGLLHAWMTALEVRMNDIVVRLSTQYHALGRSLPESTLLLQPEPFGVAFSKAWRTFAAWFGIGCAFTIIIFLVALGNPIVIFVFFMISVVGAAVYNFAYSDTSGFISLDSSDVEAWPSQIVVTGDTICEPENTVPQTSGM